MICKVKLRNRSNFIEINLNKELSNENKQLKKELIYQNQKYETVIIIEGSLKEVQKIEVYINNECISDRFTGLDVILIGENIFKIKEEYIFSTIFGFANISIEIIYIDKSIEYYYSEYIAVGINEADEESLISIQQMIEYIYDKNSVLLYSSNIDRVSNILSGTEYSQNREIDTEISLLNQIISTYNINLKYFMNNLQYKVLSNNSIDDFKKVKKINNDTIRFIARNPQELELVTHNTGITYNGQNLQPIKTLISKSYNCYDIYENKIIIGFLKYLINEIILKIRAINGILEENQISSNLKKEVQGGYILSSEIVFKYSRITMKKYLQELELIKEELKKLYFKYRSIIRCDEAIIKSTPKPTKIFLSINHYRNIFTIIDKWFKHGNYDILKNQIILSFLTADEIYEYYCLLNIIQTIKSLGFSEDDMKREKYNYGNTIHNKGSKVSNTFYFSDGNRSIVLYYQPIIYSYNNNTRNDITLFRTDSNKNYYAPDFIIKVDSGECAIRYAILDAKWSTSDTIKKYRYKDAVFKYLFSIRDQTNLSNSNLLWLLQGRDDKSKKNVRYHNNGSISKTLGDEFKTEAGIIKLIPNSGVTEFTEIIRTVLK